MNSKLPVTSTSFTRLFEAQLAASPDNPKLLLLVSDYCLRRGSYQRASILLGRAIKLGVQTFKVYERRGRALLKIAETECLSKPKRAMARFVESARMYDRVVSLGALSGQANFRVLLDASRCYFRAGYYERAIRLLSYLIENLPTSDMPEELTETCLVASQCLLALGQCESALVYLCHVFRKLNDAHLTGIIRRRNRRRREERRKRRREKETEKGNGEIQKEQTEQNDGGGEIKVVEQKKGEEEAEKRNAKDKVEEVEKKFEDLDDEEEEEEEEEEDYDDDDVMVRRHDVINERVCALVLAATLHAIQEPAKNPTTTTAAQAKNFSSVDGTTATATATATTTIQTWTVKSAIQYAFFRHRAAVFAKEKREDQRAAAIGGASKSSSSSSSSRRKLRNHDDFDHKEMERATSTSWSSCPRPWLAAGDACFRRGHPVFASLCYRQAVHRGEMTESLAPWRTSLLARPPTHPTVAEAWMKLGHIQFLCGNINTPLSPVQNNDDDDNHHHHHNDHHDDHHHDHHHDDNVAAMVHLLHSHNIFSWHLPLRLWLLKWEPAKWSRVFTIQNVSALAIQRRARGMLVRGVSSTDRAARFIQSYWRMVPPARRYKRQRRASTIFQSAWRGVAERMGNAWRRRRREAGARGIERVWRGHCGRNQARVERWRKFEVSYNLLLRVARGYLGRQQYRHRKKSILLLQSHWRGYECRLTMWAIGVLPLIRWTQIGSCFVPITYIRRKPTFRVEMDMTEGGTKQLVPRSKETTMTTMTAASEEFVPAEVVDLTVAGRRLVPNVQLDSIHNATILARIERAERIMEGQLERASSHLFLLERREKEEEAKRPDYEEMRKDMRERQEKDIREYLESKGRVSRVLQSSEIDLDRCRRRLKSVTPHWLNTLAECFLDLNKYGHQPLNFWRARVQLHLKSAKESLIQKYGEDPPRDLLRYAANIDADLNIMSAQETRRRMSTLMESGESFERRCNRQWRTLDDEFRGARKRLRHAVRSVLLLKRRIRRLNMERDAEREELRRWERKEREESEEREEEQSNSSRRASGETVVMDATVLAGAIDPAVSGKTFGRVLLHDVATNVGVSAAAEAVLRRSSGRLKSTTESDEKQQQLDTTSMMLLPESIAHDALQSSSSRILMEGESPVTKKKTPTKMSKKEMALRKRCDILLHRTRTRSNVDHLLAEWRRLLARCASEGAWRLALECHICMSKQHLPRDEATYRNVITAIKHACEIVPPQVIVAVLDEMIDEDMAGQRTFHVCMGAIARDTKSWRHAVVIFQKMRAAGHHATSATYEILTSACVNADPTDCYDALKFSGVPEYFAYSIGRRSLQLR